MDDAQYIEIEPLQPPFDGTVVKVHFSAMDKVLALSQADFDRLCNFLGTDEPWNREIMLGSSPDSARIRITSVQ